MNFKFTIMPETTTPPVTFAEMRAMVLDPDRPRRTIAVKGVNLPGANFLKSPQEVGNIVKQASCLNTEPHGPR